MADTFLLHVNEYGIRPELPPPSFSEYGYYVYRDVFRFSAISVSSALFA
jgi:hypothetical protein